MSKVAGSAERCQVLRTPVCTQCQEHARLGVRVVGGADLALSRQLGWSVRGGSSEVGGPSLWCVV